MIELTEFQKHVIFSGRGSGKTEYMRRKTEELLDKSPDAKVYITKSDGTYEVIENAEFEEVTNWIPEKAEPQ